MMLEGEDVFHLGLLLRAASKAALEAEGTLKGLYEKI